MRRAGVQSCIGSDFVVLRSESYTTNEHNDELPGELQRRRGQRPWQPIDSTTCRVALVTKTLPENFDLNRIAGVVRLGGGTGTDSIQISVANADGLDVQVKKQTLDLAEYTYNAQLNGSNQPIINGVALPEGISHADVQSALNRSNKELDLGILNRLADNQIPSTKVQISKDDKLHEFKLTTYVSDLQRPWKTSTTPTLRMLRRFSGGLKLKRSREGLQLTGLSEIESTATFSLDQITSILLDPTFQAMVTADVAGASTSRTR